MTDVHNKETRSYNMRRIRGKDTKPEMIVRKYLFSQGFRYRVHNKDLPGKPDIVLSKYKTVIFVHGCFWHSHQGCSYFVIPKSKTDWWIRKLEGNKKRDHLKYELLSQAGWKIIIVWECALKKAKERTLNGIISTLTASEFFSLAEFSQYDMDSI